MRLLQWETPLFFICSFYCCLVKDAWTKKVVQQSAIRGLVAYKLIAYKKPSVSKRLSAKVYTLSPFYFTSLQKQSPVLFYKKVVLKYFAIITEKYLFWGLFLIKLQPFSPATLLKRNSNTAAFLWILRKVRLLWNGNELFLIKTMIKLSQIDSKKCFLLVFKKPATW